ncbi:MAG: RdgB/HAM1 family non-canonical purine NTP pyrophosphatase [Pseudomonadota bacterium]
MATPRRVVLATGNAGKLREFNALLAPLSIELIPQGELGIIGADETGTTFEANALLKARHAAQAARLPALADDSGIEVDALEGRPGVWSARYAGPQASDADNNALLLTGLQCVPPARRTARYRCVIAYVRDGGDPSPMIARGSWEGTIADAPAGAGGFGYDSLFIPTGFALTAAQIPAATKNALSHRAIALAELLRLLQ